MASARPALLAAVVAASALLPSCGHKGPPLPPRLRTPPTISDFRLAQRGDVLEMSLTAPGTSVDGLALRSLDIELYWGEGFVDLEEEGQKIERESAPGARVVETVPLPEAGTIVRAAVRATSGGDRGQRSLILAIQTHGPLSPPHELTARLRGSGVGLNWRGARPEKLPPPDLSPLLDEGGGAPDALGREDTGGAAGSPGGPRAPSSLPEGAADETAGAASSSAGASETPPSPAVGTAEAPPPPLVETAGGASPEGEDEEGEPEETDEEAPEEVGARTHGFRVYRRTAGQGYGVPLNYEPQERRLFTDPTAPLGSTACYVIRAVGSTEPLIESATSNEVCIDVRDISPPAAPTGLAVVPRSGGLEVVWSPSSAPDLQAYRIYRRVGEGDSERAAEVEAGTTTWLDEATRPGRLYEYSVTAVDGAGNESPPSGSAQGRGP